MDRAKFFLFDYTENNSFRQDEASSTRQSTPKTHPLNIKTL